MVKLQDGSLVPARELLGGEGEDTEGKPLKFIQVKGAAIPTFEAKCKMDDGSGRTRTYRFGLDDTNVVVHMIMTDETQEKATATIEEEEKETEAKESQPKKNVVEEETTASKRKPYTVEKSGFTVGPQNKK